MSLSSYVQLKTYNHASVFCTECLSQEMKKISFGPTQINIGGREQRSELVDFDSLTVVDL